MSPQVARGTRGVDVPKAKSLTRRDLDQLEDQATRHQVLCDKQQHHQGLPLEPSDARRGNGQDEQQPCPNGHHPGGVVLGRGALCSLQIRKNNPNQLQQLSCIWRGASSLSPVLSAREVTSGFRALFCALSLGGTGQNWSQGVCGRLGARGLLGGELGRFGRQRGGGGAPAAAAS